MLKTALLTAAVAGVVLSHKGDTPKEDDPGEVTIPTRDTFSSLITLDFSFPRYLAGMTLGDFKTAVNGVRVDDDKPRLTISDPASALQHMLGTKKHFIDIEDGMMFVTPSSNPLPGVGRTEASVDIFFPESALTAIFGIDDSVSDVIGSGFAQPYGSKMDVQLATIKQGELMPMLHGVDSLAIEDAIRAEPADQDYVHLRGQIVMSASTKTVVDVRATVAVNFVSRTIPMMSATAASNNTTLV